MRDNYAGSSKPRVIAVYTQLTSLKKNANETITDYILRAESATNALRDAEEIVSDVLLVAMAVKGLPDTHKAFVAVTTQSQDMIQNFQKFKQALKNFEDTERTRMKSPANPDTVMKTGTRKKKFTCFNCGIAGHKATDCRKPKEQRWCNYCKSPTHNDSYCRKQKQTKTKLVNESNDT